MFLLVFYLIQIFLLTLEVDLAVAPPKRGPPTAIL